jgi:hypothetical protein
MNPTRNTAPVLGGDGFMFPGDILIGRATIQGNLCGKSAVGGKTDGAGWTRRDEGATGSMF